MASERFLESVFSQTLTARPGLYANPVFGMMLRFLSLVRDQRAQVVLVAPGWGGSPYAPRFRGNDGVTGEMSPRKTRWGMNGVNVPHTPLIPRRVCVPV